MDDDFDFPEDSEDESSSLVKSNLAKVTTENAAYNAWADMRAFVRDRGLPFLFDISARDFDSFIDTLIEND